VANLLDPLFRDTPPVTRWGPFQHTDW
jgi:hypothetical protein